MCFPTYYPGYLCKLSISVIIGYKIYKFALSIELENMELMSQKYE